MKFDLIGNATDWPWRCTKFWAWAAPKEFFYPLKLTAISVEYNSEKISLNEFMKSSPGILLGDVVGIE